MQAPIRVPTHPGIRIDKIPVSGTMGLVFTIASMVIFLAVPAVRWFAILALPVGLAVAAALHFAGRK
jgi:hypothetical protein